MSQPIGISRIHFPVTTLGPGQRVGIWFQGCSIRCPGCISADTWAFRHDMVQVGDVVTTLVPWLDNADGITVSGGEPFDQPDALLELLQALKDRCSHDILVFSGHPFEAIREHVSLADGLIDALMTDPYDHKETQLKPLRGSDNQRLHLLTPLGKKRFESYKNEGAGPHDALDVLFDSNGEIFLAGIPRHGDFERLSALLEVEGHSVRTSQDSSTKKQVAQ